MPVITRILMREKKKKNGNILHWLSQVQTSLQGAPIVLLWQKKMLSIVYIAVINVYITFIDFCYINAVVSAMNEILWIFIFLKYKE